MRPSSSRVAPLVVCLLAVAGCGDKGIKKITVKGTVTYKGKTVPSGILQFVGPTGEYSAASIQPDGTFIITDVVPCEMKVGIQSSPSGSGSSSGQAGPKVQVVELPQKYRDANSSGLKYTITEDTKELAIKIE